MWRLLSGGCCLGVVVCGLKAVGEGTVGVGAVFWRLLSGGCCLVAVVVGSVVWWQLVWGLLSGGC